MDNIRISNKYRKSALYAIIFTFIIIPIILNIISLPQQLEIKGIYIKNNSRVFSRFLNDIKNANGVLVLGTSETGAELDGYNYYDFLNNDEEININFSSLGGAGRNEYIYFPSIILNHNEFNKLKVLYFINPTYWRKTLNFYNVEYYKNYVSSEIVNSVKEEAINQNLYKDFMFEFYSKFPDTTNYINKLINGIVDYKSYYYYDINLIFNHLDNENIFKSINNIDELKKDINLEYGVKQSIIDKYGVQEFYEISKSDFQYKALNTFMDLASTYDIDVTFFIGPYNKIYAQKVSPEFIGGHEATIDSIRNIVLKRNFKLIDGSYLSDEPGVFDDYQHHSKYGAYCMYKLIKHYYEESN